MGLIFILFLDRLYVLKLEMKMVLLKLLECIWEILVLSYKNHVDDKKKKKKTCFVKRNNNT